MRTECVGRELAVALEYTASAGTQPALACKVSVDQVADTGLLELRSAPQPLALPVLPVALADGVCMEMETHSAMGCLLPVEVPMRPHSTLNRKPHIPALVF
jgi:hypothetical protein